MHEASAIHFKVCSTAHQIRLLIEELKCADALEILFGHHKNDTNFWVALKNYLISTSLNHREFSLLSLLIECSSKTSICQSSGLIPGLYIKEKSNAV